MVQTALIGVGINTLGGISTAIGWWLQKEGHNKSNTQNSSIYKSCHWWIGFVLVLLSQPLYIISQTLANQSTLGVVGPTSIIVHVMFARFYLHEVLSWWEILGILFFVPGTIITLIFASKSNDLLNKEEFNEKFWNPIAQIYLWGNVCCCIVLYFLAYKIIKETTNQDKGNKPSEEERQDQDGESILEDSETQSLIVKNSENGLKQRKITGCKEEFEETDMVAEDSDEELISKTWTKWKSHNEGCKNWENCSVKFSEDHGKIDEETQGSWFSHPRLRLIPLVTYPYIGAFMGSISTCMVRVLTGFYVQKGADKKIDLTMIIPGIILVFWAIMSYIIVNKGLKAFDSVYVAPLFKIGAMIASLTTGGVILDEFSSYSQSPTNFKLFLFGCGIWLFGIILLVMGNDFNEKEEQAKKKQENCS